VDGTFKSCPKLFSQIFTPHGLKNNNYISLVFFLLPNKNIDTYIKAFSHLKSEFLKNNINFSPKIIFADFEKAIHSYLLIVWPSVQMKRMPVSFRSKLVEKNSNDWFKPRIQKKFRYQCFFEIFFWSPIFKTR